MGRRTMAALLAGMLALAITACGGDDSDEACGGLQDAGRSFNPQDPDVAQLYADMAEEAPSEIKGDFQTVSDRMQQLQDASSNPSALSSLGTASSDMNAALSRISAYVAANC